ncbi:MAG: glycerol-3-phosphate acyltransferase [Oscillospiraceae bacterium]|nr:glycerol-3-phosphate acyltransferase [Oscillospiraceae bacterium]
MEIAFSLIIGYLLGSLNPAALLSKLKNINFREQGTGNLGASNTLLILGKKYGAVVMLFDIIKAVIAAKLAKWLFPQLALANLLAGSAAVVGHVFPFYLRFQGGKGLAAFGGLVLAYDPAMFLFLLLLGVVLMLIVNYSYILPMSAAFLFPFLALYKSQRVDVFLLTLAASALVIIKHWSNIGRARRGEEMKIREFIKEKLFSKG